VKQFRKNDANSKYHMGKLFHYTVKRGDEVAWNAENHSNESSIGIVKTIMNKNTPMITKMTYEGHGKLFDATLYSAEKANEEAYVPLKMTDDRLQDVTKYGGYSSVSTAHFFLVEHEVKRKRIRTLEALPLMLKESIGTDIEKLNVYCNDVLKLKNPDVRLAKIKLHALVKRDGFYMTITGKTNKQFVVSNAVPLVLSRKWVNYIKKIEKAVDSSFSNAAITSDLNKELYLELTEKHANSIFSKRPNPIGKTLNEGLDYFVELNLQDQCMVLSQILQITQLSNLGANFELIKGSKTSGKSLISKNISGCEEFLLVNQSITGLYRSETDLLTL
jgi:CRISPR-associated endonuclease Csn1